MDIINWIISNIGNICTVLCGVVLLSSMIVKLTPSTKDNDVLRNIINFLDMFSIAQTADNKKYIEDAKKNIEHKAEVKAEEAKAEAKLEEVKAEEAKAEEVKAE